MTRADEYCTQLRNENRTLLAQLEDAKEQVAASALFCADHQELLVKHLKLHGAAKLALDSLDAMTRYFNIVRLGESRLKDTEARCQAHVAMEALKENT